MPGDKSDNTITILQPEQQDHQKTGNSGGPASVILPIAAVIGAIVALIFGADWYFSSYKPIQDVKTAIRERMIDPDSTQFRNVSVTSSRFVCGEANAKNSFGAYVGFRWFESLSGPAHVIVDDEKFQFAEKSCSHINPPAKNP
jgi:hypothetical protein